MDSLDTYWKLLHGLENWDLKSLLILTITLFLAGRLGSKELKKLKVKKSLKSLQQLAQLIRAKTPNDNAAALVFGQMYHETAGATSSLYRNNNNLFGMKNPSVRSTTSIGSDIYNYAIYESPERSIDDLAEWFNYNGMNLAAFGSAEEYVNALKNKHYFEDSTENYLRGVKFGIAQYFQNIA